MSKQGEETKGPVSECVSSEEFMKYWRTIIERTDIVTFTDVDTKTKRAKMYEFLKMLQGTYAREGHPTGLHFSKYKISGGSGYICKKHDGFFECEDDPVFDDKYRDSCSRSDGTVYKDNWTCIPRFVDNIYHTRIKVSTNKELLK